MKRSGVIEMVAVVLGIIAIIAGIIYGVPWLYGSVKWNATRAAEYFMENIR